MLKNNRQGVELSANTMIIFALVILVLIVLAFMLMRGFSGWNKTTGCEARDGICKDVKQPCGDGYIVSAYSCDNDLKCCTKSMMG